MGATAKFVARQIKRMSGLDRFPDADGQDELGAALIEACRSDSHVKRVADEVMREFTICPKPAELRAIADSAKGEECTKCVKGWVRTGPGPDDIQACGCRCVECHDGWIYAKNGAGVVRCKCQRKGAAA